MRINKHLLLCLYLLPFTFLYSAPKAARVLIVLNEGYRPEEYFEPRKLFDNAGFHVKVASHYTGNVLPSRPHIREVPPVPSDLTFDKVSVDDYDAVIFVGGNGAWNDFMPNPDVHKILLNSMKAGKLTALICAATGLLATAGNLDGQHPQFEGKHVTGFFEVEGMLKTLGHLKYDAGVAKQPYVVTDGKLITGRDPISAKLFGETIVAALK